MRKGQLGGLLAAAGWMLAACTGAGSGDGAQHLNVEAHDLAFSPTRLEVRAGEPVVLTLQNNGALEHDFSVLEMPLEGAAEASGGSDHGHGGAEAPVLHVSALGGQSATLEFTASTPGIYEFWCTVAGHKEAGMAGTLVVLAPE
jgi:uncharacterized cupredoxin-like copper-binding protein